MNDSTSDRPSSLPRQCRTKDGRPYIIRTVTEADAAAFCDFMPKTHTESDFLNYLPGEWKLTVDEEREFIRKRNALPCSLLLAAELDGRLVGAAGASAQELKRFEHQAECGLTVLKALWRQGIGRTTMECVIDWCRERRLRKLGLRVVADNERALALYRSLGFVEEGRLVGDARRVDGTYGDTIVMARHLIVD